MDISCIIFLFYVFLMCFFIFLICNVRKKKSLNAYFLEVRILFCQMMLLNDHFYCVVSEKIQVLSWVITFVSSLLTLLRTMVSRPYFFLDELWVWPGSLHSTVNLGSQWCGRQKASCGLYLSCFLLSVASEDPPLTPKTK